MACNNLVLLVKGTIRGVILVEYCSYSRANAVSQQLFSTRSRIYSPSRYSIHKSVWHGRRIQPKEYCFQKLGTVEYGTILLLCTIQHMQ
jgi:hypothetical protein